MKKILLIALIPIFTLISCTTTKQSSSTTRVMDVYGPGIIQLPVVGELEVDINKVSETVTGSGTGVNAENLKIAAVNKAVKNAGADILVEPSFEIRSEGNRTIVVVTGFPATYTGFRAATQHDIPLIEAGQLQQASVFETQEISSAENQTNNKLLLILSLGGLAGLAYIMSGN